MDSWVSACFLMVITAAVSLPACASANANEDRMLDEMRREMAETTSDGDMDKLGASAAQGPVRAPSSIQQPAPALPPPPTAMPPRTVATPALPVVRVDPTEADESSELAGTGSTPGAPTEPVLVITNANLLAAVGSPSNAPKGSSNAGKQGKPKARKPSEPPSQGTTP
jgi:hypothetical protein